MLAKSLPVNRLRCWTGSDPSCPAVSVSLAATSSHSTAARETRGANISSAAAAVIPAAVITASKPMARNDALPRNHSGPNTTQALVLPSTVALPSSEIGGCVSTDDAAPELVLGAFHVRAVRGHHHDLGADADEGRHHGAHPVRQQRRLVGRGGGLAFDGWLGLHHFEDRLLRELDRDRHALMHGERDLHFGLEIGRLVADDVRGQGDLVVVFGIHEMEAVAVLVEELVLAILHVCAFDLLGRLITLGDFDAITDPAHVDLGGRRALTRMETLGVQHDVELAVELDDIAFAKRAGDDPHGCGSLILAGQAVPAAGAPDSGGNIPILRLCASSFRTRNRLEGA